MKCIIIIKLIYVCQQPIFDDSTASDISDVLDDVDDYLDEALAHNNSGSTLGGPTPPKKGKVTTVSVSSFVCYILE